MSFCEPTNTSEIPVLLVSSVSLPPEPHHFLTRTPPQPLLFPHWHLQVSLDLLVTSALSPLFFLLLEDRQDVLLLLRTESLPHHPPHKQHEDPLSVYVQDWSSPLNPFSISIDLIPKVNMCCGPEEKKLQTQSNLQSSKHVCIWQEWNW